MPNILTKKRYNKSIKLEKIMSKNRVYALKSFTQNKNLETVHDGYLMFPSEEKADSFLEICKVVTKQQNNSHYEKHEFVDINDFIANKVETQRNFFVKDISQYLQPL